MELPEKEMSWDTIREFPFPYKLWLVADIEELQFISWSFYGDSILINRVDLATYMQSPRSIFKIKTIKEFFKYLESYQFDQINICKEVSNVMEYKSENFQRSHIDLVANMRFHTYYDFDNGKGSDNSFNTHEIIEKGPIAKDIVLAEHLKNRMTADFCFMQFGSLTNLQKNRILYQTVAHHQRETRILEEKLKIFTESVSQRQPQRRMRINPATGPDGRIRDILGRSFTNPLENLDKHAITSQEDVMGFYGECTREELDNFFSGALPTVEAYTKAIMLKAIKKQDDDSSSDLDEKMANFSEEGDKTDDAFTNNFENIDNEFKEEELPEEMLQTKDKEICVEGTNSPVTQEMTKAKASVEENREVEVDDKNEFADGIEVGTVAEPFWGMAANDNSYHANNENGVLASSFNLLYNCN